MRRTSVWIMVVLGALVIGCASDPAGDAPVGGKGDDPGFNNFQTAVAAERDFDIYWLGREFAAGGVSYRGPDVADFGDDVEGGGLAMDYVGDIGSLKVTLYSPNAWNVIEAKRATAIRPRFEVKNVAINGRPAKLRTNYGTLNPISAQVLSVSIDDTFVEVTTGAVVPPGPTDPQPNPLMDEATFLSVVENLRPYPE